jgi:hypothetical protein
LPNVPRCQKIGIAPKDKEDEKMKNHTNSASMLCLHWTDKRTFNALYSLLGKTSLWSNSNPKRPLLQNKDDKPGERGSYQKIQKMQHVFSEIC